MEVPKFTLLDNVQVFLNSNRGDTVYSILDRVTNQQYFVDDETAQLVSRYQNTDSGQFFREISRPEFERLYQFTSNVRRSRALSYFNKKRFNPLFFGFRITNIARFQPRLKPLADFLVRKWQIGFSIVALFVTLWLGSQNEWAIKYYFNDIFSVKALLSFAVAAPLLKIFHEFGHVLAATRFNVPVGNLAINFVGFYPLPNVDVSQADYLASRKQRIIISLAGIYVDFIIACFVLVFWYFSKGDFWKSFLGHVFAYNAIQSVVFNINPLIKLDGYYVFSDLINYRNLYSNASQVSKSFLKYLFSLGKNGVLPKNRQNILLLIYALASTLYRIRVIFFVAWQVLPKYLGLGTLIVLWGAYIMFAAPLIARLSRKNSSISRTENTEVNKQSSGNSKGWILLGAVLLVILLFPMSFKTVQMGRLDYFGTLLLSNRTDGALLPFTLQYKVENDAVLLQLKNDRLLDQLYLKIAEGESVKAETYNVSGQNPTQTQYYYSKADKIQQQIEVIESQVEQLQIRAQEAGVFLMNSQLKSGYEIERGTYLGSFLPEKKGSEIIVPLPEKYVQFFFDGEERSVGMRVRDFEGVQHVEIHDIKLEPRVQLGAEKGERSYQLRLKTGLSPQSLHGNKIDVKIRFHSAPIYRHIQFAISGFIQDFRNSQIYWNSKDLKTPDGL